MRVQHMTTAETPTNVVLQKQSRATRSVAIGIRTVAIALAAFAIFNLGALWSTRVFLLDVSLHGPQLHPDPFLMHFYRMALAAFWPMPGAALLFLSTNQLRAGKGRWWITLLVAVAWFVAYLLIKPPQLYFYWLAPIPTQ